MRITQLLCCLVTVLAGCASHSDRIVLLPDEHGKVGAIAVLGGTAESTIIDSAYAQATVHKSGKVKAIESNAANVQKDFRQTLAAQPPAPVSYMLYFEMDSNTLIEESADRAGGILADIAQRPAADVILIGHTDRVGELTYNDGLSLERAQATRRNLLDLGLAPERITVAGRGEREPLIQTDDEVAEPRNRRVELIVR